MRAFRWVSCIVVLSMVFGMCANPQTVKAQPINQDQINRSTLYVPGEVVVAFKGGGASAQYNAQASALAGQVGAQVVGSFANAALLSFAPDADVQALSKQLASAQGVILAEPNYISWIPEEEAKVKSAQHHLTEITRTNKDGQQQKISVNDLLSMRTISHTKAIPTYPNDEFNSWGNAKIGADIIANNSNASPQVCVLDTGADMSHPDLSKKVVAGYDFVNNDTSVVDDNGHGTHVTGTIVAKMGDGIGPAGISNGQVLAVKVMSAQGWGTDFDVSEGLVFCANKPSVKVINMSLGGPDDTFEYTYLQYAIEVMGKLVVAAAGNDSGDYSTNNVPDTYAPIYPAGYAASTYDISFGVISVAAARGPWTSYDSSTDTYSGQIWVDLNGDGIAQPDEFFSDCATSFTNYGSWVDIVAPGEDIYSTTPYSSPFWLNQYAGIAPGYDWLSGTSMATPHVAAAAARAWSLHMGKTGAWVNGDVKYHLINSGTPLNIAEDPEFSSAQTQTKGYNTPGFTGDGPYCWPQSMSGASYLNVAAVMNRGAIDAEAIDATTGLPLVGAQIQAVAEPNTVVTTSAISSPYSRWTDLVNLPIGPVYDLRVSAPGYTSGFITYWHLTPPAGVYFYSTHSVAAVPPLNKNITIVSNWKEDQVSGTDQNPQAYSSYDLDMYLWLPYNNAAVIGPQDPGQPDYAGVGDLATFPFARYFRDSSYDSLPIETISVVTSGAYPYYNSAVGDQIYEVLLNAPSLKETDLNDAAPNVRVWYGGKIVTFLDFGTHSCTSGQIWWDAIRFYRSGSSTHYDLVDQCGTGIPTGSGGVWPYSLNRSTNSNISSQPVK